MPRLREILFEIYVYNENLLLANHVFSRHKEEKLMDVANRKHVDTERRSKIFTDEVFLFLFFRFNKKQNKILSVVS